MPSQFVPLGWDGTAIAYRNKRNRIRRLLSHNPKEANNEGLSERMGMKRVCFPILVFVFVGLIPSIAFSEDVFAPVKKVYLNDGKMIECQMGWLDGARIICRKFGGNMTLPLQTVNFEKTFTKYKKADGETILLVHPGPRYQDENIVISNVRMVRASESQGKSSCVVICEIMNRGDPCEILVKVNALDAQGKILHQIDVPTESRLDTGESAVLRRRLDGAAAALENQMIFFKVSQVERSNVQETLLNGKRAGYRATGSGADGNQDSVREEKIRALKDAFLRERPSSP
jgi:hypothetical protein